MTKNSMKLKAPVSIHTAKQLFSYTCLFLALALGGVAPFMLRHGGASKSTHQTTTNDLVEFTSGGHVLGFAKDRVYAAGGSHSLRVEFVNAHSTNPVGAAISNDAKIDKKAAPLSKVTYPNLWDGVTLTYDAPNGAIARSTYRLEPHANAENIRLRYNAPVSVRHDGSLQISFQTGVLTESAPQAWQERDGKRAPVQVAFAARGEHEVGFAVGQYDRSQPLFIDPTLTWNTFLGGTGSDGAYAVTVDKNENVYVAGYSYSTWGSPVRAFTDGVVNAFVAKLDSSGNLTWNTFLGGNNLCDAFAVAVDGSGNVYVAGESYATWGSPVSAFNAADSAFVAKLDSSGNLTWNTFFGDGGGHRARAVAVDKNGNVYVAGESTTTWGSPVRAHTASGSFDAFVAKLDSSGSLTWNTFLGASSSGDYHNNDYGSAVAVDGNGNVYVAGTSYATWGSPVRAFSSGGGSIFEDAFAAKLDSNGNLIWNTFLGGDADDDGTGVAVDGSGNVYVAGYSYYLPSYGFTTATWGSPVHAFSGYGDAFAAKLDSSGNLTWNTFLGGTSSTYADTGNAVAVDGSGNVYVAGTSYATWGSPDIAFSGGTSDAFAASLNSNGGLIWNAFLGGPGVDNGLGIKVDGAGRVYVAGDSTATWGSPVRPFTESDGSYEAFVAKLGPPNGVLVQTNPAGLTFNVDGTDYSSAQTFSWVPGSTHTISTTTPQNGDPGVRYYFSSWSDGGAISHTITATNGTTYTAKFGTQYYLTMNAGTGGKVSPASSWRTSGTTVSITATPTDNTLVSYSFSNWTGSGPGSFTGTANPASITMNGPITETASFTQNPIQVTVQTTPAGVTFNVDGTDYSATQTFSWAPGSTHTIATTTPQSGDPGVRYYFSNWSDGGAISHTVAPTKNTTYTAKFGTQYYLTMNAGTGGTVSPPSSWRSSGTIVSISAKASAVYTFTNWTGSGSGSFTGTANPASITMNGPITETATFTHN